MTEPTDGDGQRPVSHGDARAGSVRPDPYPIEAFAGDVAHDLRVPLAALSGEIDLALRRDRPAAEYRDALARCADRVAELVELAEDVALLIDPPSPERSSASAGLDAILAIVAERYGSGVSIDPAQPGFTVAAPLDRAARSLTLLVDHALDQRRGDASLRLVLAAGRDAPTDAGTAVLVLEASDPGFQSRAWQHVLAPVAGAATRAPGRLRLMIAARMLEQSGSWLTVRPAESTRRIEIHLRRA